MSKEYAWTSGTLYGIAADEDKPSSKVLDVLLNDYYGRSVSDLSEAQQSTLEEALSFVPLRSVVKRDLESLDSDYQWHTEGTGNRFRPAWWIDCCLVESVIEELETQQ